MEYLSEKGLIYTLLYLQKVFIISSVQNFEGQFISILHLTTPINQLHRFGRCNDRDALMNCITCSRMFEIVINIQM